LTHDAAQVPVAVVSRTAKAASLFAAGKVVGFAEAAALAEGVLKIMLWNKIRGLAAVLLTVAALGMGIGGFGYPSEAQPAAGPVQAAGKPEPARKGKARPPVPGAVPLEFDRKVTIGVRSRPVKVGKDDVHIVSVGTGVFRLTKESQLKATLNAAVVQQARVDYWVSAAVFDEKGRLLGAASHKEAVQRVRLGRVPTVFRQIPLDFGVSRDFSQAAYVVVAVSNPEVATP
jgi:hypothetical protein